MNKVIIGENNYLFLYNDSNNSIYNHINNIDLNPTFEHYKKYLNIFKIFIFPDKEIICNKHLPKEFNKILHRPILKKYKDYFGDNCIILNNLEDTDYYKTDTHMNNKGLLKYFNKFMKILNIDKQYEIIKIKTESLNKLNIGLGDLTWKCNTNIENIIEEDDYYKINNLDNFFCSKYENINEKYKILTKDLIDISNNYINNTIDWECISKNILYNKTNKYLLNYKVLFFYDSFLLHSINLYKSIFREIYLCKTKFNNIIIDKIKPDFIYEFRVERFL